MENSVIVVLKLNCLENSKTKDWSWEASANISFNKNKVVALPDNGLELNRQGGQQIYTGEKFTNEKGEIEYAKNGLVAIRKEKSRE